MVIQSKNNSEDIRVYVYLWGMSVACVHEPFPTLSSDAVLDQVVGKEAYSFTDGFSGYH
jgi:hypothetical protein